MLRLLHASPSYPPLSGGIARYTHALATARPAGSCTVLTGGTSGRTTTRREAGVRVINVARQGVIHSAPTGQIAIGLAPRLQRLSASAQIVHAHLPFPMLLGAPLDHRARLVATFHNEIGATLGIPRPLRALHERLQRRLLKRAAAIVVTTADYAANCIALAGLQHKVRIVPYGIDADAFSKAGAGVRREDELLLFVGRVNYYKGLDVLLHALVAVPAARLLIAGNGPELDNVARLAQQLGLTNRVTLLGYVPEAELPRLYSRAAALVLPSTDRGESFGIVQLEAFACGTPVISSALPGVREVNAAGESGLLVEPGDPGELAGAIRRLLDDRELRARLGEQAGRRVREKFSKAALLDGIEEVYGEVMGGE